MREQKLLEQQARQDFIDGVITALKIDELIENLIAENKEQEKN